MKTTASFIQPFMNPTAPVTVHVDSTDELVEGQTILIPAGGHYMVSAILNEHQVQLVNLALATNAVQGATVPRGRIVASGTPELSTVVLGIDLVVDVQTANAIFVPVSLGGTGPVAMTLFSTSGSLPVDGTRLVFDDVNAKLGGPGNVDHFNVSYPSGFIKFGAGTGNNAFVWGPTGYTYIDLTYCVPANIWIVNNAQ